MKFIIKACISFLFSTALLGLFAYLSACSSMGETPSKQAQRAFHDSEQFIQEGSVFKNIHQDVVDKMDERDIKWGTLLKSFIFGIENGEPPTKLPEVKPDFSTFVANDASSYNALKVIWFGHSSLYLNIDNVRVLIDPVFYNAAPLNFLVPRFQKSIATPQSIPVPDVILISHDHYDHLEMETVEYYADKNVKFVVPLGVSAHLLSWGVAPYNIIEKDWWGSEVVKGIEFIATPAQHFSGRGFTRNQSLWASWIIRTNNHSVFFSGDTGYHDQFSAIGEKYGPFDIAFMENGQYNQDWREIHLFPEEGIKAYQALNAKKYFPIHWGMFLLSLHSWDEPIKTIHQLALQHNIELVTPVIGEVVDINSEHNASAKPENNKPWWQYLNKYERTKTHQDK